MKHIYTYAKGKETVFVKKCAGAFTVKPAGSGDLDIRGDEVACEETGDGYRIIAPNDLELRLPPWALVQIDVIHGEAEIKGIPNEITLNTVHGDVVFKHAAGGTINAIFGSLLAKHLSGDLRIGRVSGDVAIKHIGAFHLRECQGNAAGRYFNGDVTLERCDGDVNLRQINGNLTIVKAGNDVVLNDINGILSVHTAGDLHLRADLIQGKHLLKADHDVILRWQGGRPLTVSGAASAVVNRLEWDEFGEANGRFQGRLGQDGPQLEIDAGSRVVFKESGRDAWPEEDIEFEFEFDFGRDFEAFGQRMAGLGEQIAAQVSRKMSDLSAQLEGQFKAMRKREEAVRRARERVDRYPFSTPRPPAPKSTDAPPSARPTAASQETVDTARLKVLEMLEQGKISIEEANVLLKALE